MHPEGVGAKFANRKDLTEEIQRVLSKQSRRQAMREQVQEARAGKAVLRVISGLLSECVDEAENRLLAARVEIYQRGDFVVRPGIIERRTAAGEILRKPGLVPVTPYNMVELFTSVIDFQNWDKRSDEWRSIDCPLSFATTYLQRTRHWRLRPLTAIITAPTLRPDGSILETAGYDEQTGILYDPLGVSFPPVPKDPTEEDALIEHCHGDGGRPREADRIASWHAPSLLSPASLSTADHPARDLALPPFHAELPRR